jgi:hypothetical protein
MKNPATSPPSAFAQEKGKRLAQGVQDALHPIVNDRGLVAARVYFLYEADGGMQGGAVTLQLGAGATTILDELIKQRIAGAIEPSVHGRRIIPVMRKS